MTKKYTFIYDGKKRVIVDASFEEEYNSIVGFEVDKDGKKSNQIKRFKIEKINV